MGTTLIHPTPRHTLQHCCLTPQCHHETGRRSSNNLVNFFRAQSAERGRLRLVGSIVSARSLADLIHLQCDRTKPCSACCARGLPKECHFVLGEGTEFGPIQQSLELRKLRGENQRLKERLIAAKLPLSDDSDEDDTSSTGRGGPSNRRAASRQKRFRTTENTDSLYFGSPGLANVISDVRVVLVTHRTFH